MAEEVASCLIISALYIMCLFEVWVNYVGAANGKNKLQHNHLKRIDVHVFVTIGVGTFLYYFSVCGIARECVYVSVCIICHMINCSADLAITYFLSTIIYTI